MDERLDPDRQRHPGEGATAPAQGDAGPFEDFDHHTTHHTRHGEGDYRRMRESCPIAHSSSYGGFWVVSRYADVTEAARQPDVLSSALDPDRGPVYRGVMIPPRYAQRHSLLEMDGQDWRDIRTALNPWFTPRALEPLEPRIRELADRAIDGVIEQGRIDLALDYAVMVPAVVTLEIMGVPEEADHWREYADPHHEVVYQRPGSPGFTDILARIDAVHKRLARRIAERRRAPGDDLLSSLTAATFRGAPMSDELVLEVLAQLLSGGFDTTTALLSNAFVYLDQHPEDRQRLAADPDLMRPAVEEFLRFYTPAQATGRNVTCDAEVGGRRFEGGDRLLLSWASANRDPQEFPDPDKIVLDRRPNRHAAFGMGIHRCVGAHLGRLEARVMLTQVLQRLPDYRILHDEAQRYELVGHVNGWATVPAVFTPGSLAT